MKFKGTVGGAVFCYEFNEPENCFLRVVRSKKCATARIEKVGEFFKNEYETETGFGFWGCENCYNYIEFKNMWPFPSFVFIFGFFRFSFRQKF